MNHSQEQISILLMDFHIEETNETIKNHRNHGHQQIRLQFPSNDPDSELATSVFRQMRGSRLNSARRIFGLSKFRINRYQIHPRQVCLPVNHSGWWFGTFLLFHILGRITPTAELIFFRGVGIPPTRSVNEKKCTKPTPLSFFNLG